METIDDIVREKRETADEIERKGSNQFKRELAESLRREADRIEKAARHEMSDEFSAQIQKLTDELYEASVNTSRILAELNEVRELNRKCCDENERLHAAIQPILDIVMDSATSDLSMELAINEAKRIYNESMKGTNHDE